MTAGNEAPGTGVTTDMLDGLLGAEVATARRRIAEEEAREMWPVRVTEALRLLLVRVERLEDALGVRRG